MNVLPVLGPAKLDRPAARDWIGVLAELPIFAGLGRRQLRKLVEAAQFAWYGPGDEVVAHGAPAHSLYVILAGKAKARGKRAARTLSRGDVFGEMSLLGERRSATVVATSELNVMLLPQPVARRLVETHPTLGLKLLEELARRLERLEQQAA